MAVVTIGQIRQTLKKALAYIAQAHKTNGRLLLSSNASYNPGDIELTNEMFQQVIDVADSKGKGGKPGSILAYHVIQSFKPGEIDSEKAHQIGLEFVEKICGDDYQYMIATHVDREHIHNHIIFNACNRNTFKRYRCPKTRLQELRDISDELCRKYGLDIIEKTSHSMSEIIGEKYARIKGKSTKDNLRYLIDKAVSESSSFREFQYRLEQADIEVTTRRSNLLFRDRQSMRRAVRAWRLGVAYTEVAIIARLGRREVKELTINPRMILDDTGSAYRVIIPGTKGNLLLSVAKADCVDHHDVIRIYLAKHQKVVVSERNGDYFGEFLPEQLYVFFQKPIQGAINYQRARQMKRGASSKQQKYFALVDRKVAQLHDVEKLLSIRIDLAKMTGEERKKYIEKIRNTRYENNERLQGLLVERQKIYDEYKTFSLEQAERAVLEVDEQIGRLTELLQDLEQVEKNANDLDLNERERRKGR